MTMKAQAKLDSGQFARMNKLEQSVYAHLASRPDVVHVGYEEIRLTLGHRSQYTPDFFVVDTSGRIWIVEAKGFWRDDARVKIKVAARKFPWFDFYAITKDRKTKELQWEYIKP